MDEQARIKRESVFTKKFLFQLLSIGAIFLFLLTNLFQPTFWSIQTANASVNGLGITFDANYSSPLGATIFNDAGSGFGSGQQVPAEFAVYHCNGASGEACVPGVGDFDTALVPVTGITVTAPDQGSSSRTSYSVPSFDCGRVQVDVGLPGGGGILGGKVYSAGSSCEAPPPPGGTAALSAECPGNTPTLTANWNVTGTSNCNAYIQAGGTANQISTECSGNASVTSLPVSGAVVDGGTYQFFVRDGAGNIAASSEPATVNCGAPPPSAPPSAPPSVPPAGQCPYGSTQARWQMNSSDPWGPSKTINLGQSANAGSFHDATGQFASDTTLTVIGPGANTTVSNGQAFTPPQSGTFQLRVTTSGVSGIPACEDTATLTVNPGAAQCPYGSTQARVQRNESDPWDISKTINAGESIRVGGFHNETGLLANDVNLSVTGPQNFSGLSNGQFITPAQVGTYTLTITTQGQSGPACEGTATFTVQSAPVQCIYGSTQARVQRNLQDPWDSSKTINLGEQIRVGGFHNGTGLFANDVNLNVTGPQSFSGLSNGDFITPTQAGTYTLTVTTQGQSGPDCEGTATFTVQAVPASPSPSPVVSPSPSPAVSPSPSPSAEPSPSVAPSPSPSVAPSPSPSVVPSPSPSVAPSPSPAPVGGVDVNVTNTNNNTNNNTQNQTVNVTQTGGNVGVAPAAGQVAGVSVTQLPKTGLPELAWSVLALIPTGFTLRRFRRIKTEEDDPNYIWEKRKFRANR